MQNTKVVFLIIESISREYHSRIFLANLLIRQGYSVIIGGKGIVHLTSIIKGKKYVLHKDPVFSSSKLIELSKSNGCVVDVIDEEGLMLQSDDVYVNQRLSLETLKNVDTVLCWGRYQERLINNKYPGISTNIVGNPRMDVLKYSGDKFIADKKLNNIILINTKLGQYNHKNGSEYYVNSIKDNYNITDKNVLEFRRKNQLYVKKLFFSYIDLINKISQKFPNNIIVLRPHPSESKQTWERMVKNLNNVIVTQRGSIAEWLKISKCVVHTGCSTALEARISNVPAISFEPFVKDGALFDDMLGNEISYRCYTISEVLSAIDGALKSTIKINNYEDFVSDYLYLGKKKSSELIVEHINSMIDNSDNFQTTSGGRFILIKLSIFSYLRTLNQFFKKIIKAPSGNIVWLRKNKVREEFFRVNNAEDIDIVVTKIYGGVVSINKKKT
jgi:surface carbohydrate biosynthesis protein